jgi:hypothetical protein
MGGSLFLPLWVEGFLSLHTSGTTDCVERLVAITSIIIPTGLLFFGLAALFQLNHKIFGFSKVYKAIYQILKIG